MRIKVFEKPEDVWNALAESDRVFVYTDNKPDEVQYACELTINELLEMLDDFESCCFFTIKYGE
jgi:hypothetical protein